MEEETGFAGRRAGMVDWSRRGGTQGSRQAGSRAEPARIQALALKQKHRNAK